MLNDEVLLDIRSVMFDSPDMEEARKILIDISSDAKSEPEWRERFSRFHAAYTELAETLDEGGLKQLQEVVSAAKAVERLNRVQAFCMGAYFLARSLYKLDAINLEALEIGPKTA